MDIKMHCVNLITLLDKLTTDLDCGNCPALKECKESNEPYVCCADKIYQSLLDKKYN